MLIEEECSETQSTVLSSPGPSPVPSPVPGQHSPVVNYNLEEADDQFFGDGNVSFNCLTGHAEETKVFTTSGCHLMQTVYNHFPPLEY